MRGVTWFAVANPVSDGGRGARDGELIKSALRQAGIEFELALSAYPGHTRVLAAHAAQAGRTHFLAIGGDGTLNEMLNGALECVRPDADAPTFGLIPVGRGNDWSRTHNIPRRYNEAAQVLANGRRVAHDVGIADLRDRAPRYFINAAGVGFDAHVVERTRGAKLGALSYSLALPASLLSYRAPELELRIGKEQFNGKLFLAFASLNRYCGGGMLVAPDARCDDGLFDVTLVDDISLLELIVNVKKLFDGSLASYRKVRTMRVDSLEIASAVPVNSEADGELIGVTPIRFCVRQRHIHVMVP